MNLKFGFGMLGAGILIGWLLPVWAILIGTAVVIAAVYFVGARTRREVA